MWPLTAHTFPHGVDVPDDKESTRALPIRPFPFAPRLVLPLAQHGGAFLGVVPEAGSFHLPVEVG